MDVQREGPPDDAWDQPSRHEADAAPHLPGVPGPVPAEPEEAPVPGSASAPGPSLGLGSLPR
eukprot:6988447-Pyramimonas_sp.AAC.1